MQVNNTNTGYPLSQSELATITQATTNNNTAAIAASAAASAKNVASIDSNEFLTLMLAQLKNQDPSQPVDSTQFLGQLAEMSTVQGISQLNTSFSSLSTSLTSNQALQASSLLGRQALVTSNTVAFDGSTQVTGAVNLPQASGQVVLNINDASGAVVQQINLGAQPQGLANFTWDGKLANGNEAPAGTYSLSAIYAGTNAAATSAPTLINATVKSVTMGAGSSGLTLNLSGVGNVPFSSVQQIS